MNDLDSLNSQSESIEDLQKEIRSLKRKLSLAEIDLTRTRMRSISQNRVETMWNNSIKKELQFFTLVLENTTNILLLLDFDGRFAYASSIFLKNAGLLDFSLINGRHYKDVLKPLVTEENLKRFSEAVENASTEKSTIAIEEEIDFNFTGSMRTYLIHITPMNEDDKITGIMLLFNDITEIKTSLMAANQANHAKSAFLAKMSHEIRTPMNAILGMTELIMRNDITPAVQEHILTIRQAGMNLLSIIDDILDFSKIESGKLEIIPKEYLLSSLLNDVISIINTKVLESRLRFTVYIDNTIPDTMYGDEPRIRQIMLNLLTNAVKYTERGHISFSITGEMKDNNTVILVIKVIDTGKGIRQEDFEKLFSEFSRLDLVKNTSIQGTGLGLAITHNLVKAMNGSIDVYSVYGEGSTFTVTLPQEARKGPALAMVENAKDKTTLIFERREINQTAIRDAMDSLGVEHNIVSTEDIFFREVMSKKYKFVFVASVLYDRIKAKYREFKSDAKFLLITDFGETVYEQNISIITTPVFSIPIAKFLNGTAGSSNFSSKNETIIRFIAPEANVLIVDDLNTNLKVAEGLMLPYCMKIDVCNNGIKAIEMIQAKRYDLIFMDHMMPEIDGIEATERVRNLGDEDPYYKNVPIIALTANAVSGTREMFLQNNFNDFLAKPIDKFILDSILEKWIPKEKQINIKAKASMETANIINRTGSKFEIKGLDVKKGISRTGGSMENYLNTLTVFYKDGAKTIREIKASMEKGDIQLYTIQIHAIKSALTSIGCNWLSEAAKILETAGNQRDLSFIKIHTDKFLSELDTLLVNIYSCLIETKSNK